MNDVNITDYNATVGLATSSLFIQSLWMIPFAQPHPLILLSLSAMRKMNDSIAHLHY